MKFKKITRRAVLAGAGVSAATPVAAKVLRGTRAGGGQPAPPTQQIASISPASAAFQASTPNAPVATFSVAMNPPTPPFSGQLTTGGTNAEGFHFVGASLEAPASGLVPGVYNDCQVVATQAGISNSPQSITPTLTAIASGVAFITGITQFGGINTTGPGAYYGYTFEVGAANLTLTSMGIWVVAGNRQIHTVELRGGASLSLVASVAINTALFPGGAWAYANLSTPLVLASGQTYYISVSAPYDDQYYQVSRVTTTADATLIGSLYSYDAVNWPAATDGAAFRLINFQYSTTTTLATIPGAPFIPLGRQQFSIFMPTISTVVGTIRIDVQKVDTYVFQAPAHNSVVIQYWLDGQPFGPQILGPIADASNPNLPHWPLTLDTAQLADGTHTIFLQVVDVRSGIPSAYMYLSTAQQLIVHNTGFNNGAQDLPLAPNPGNSYWWPPLPDTIHYNGNPQRSVNTFSYPFPTVRPATDPSSAFYNNPMAARSPGNYYVVDLLKNKNHEFENDVQFCTTPSGGVGTSGFGNEAGNVFVPTMVSQLQAIVPWTGGRYDSRMTAYITWIAEASDDGFVGADHTGNVTWLGIQGNSTTIVGITLDRANKLPYQKELANSLTDSQRLTRFTVVGKLASGGHDVTNWGGLNGICYDPRNTHRLYVTNILWNYILKVDMSTTPATYTRFAGVEQNTGGYSGDGGDPLSALFNGPYACIMTSDGVLLIADKFNSAIRQITTDSSGNAIALSTLCGGTVSPPNAPNGNQIAVADASPAASFTGSISGNVLTVTSVGTGYIAPGQLLSSGASGFVAGTYVASLLTGLGNTGTYNVSGPQTVASGSSFTGVAVPWNPTYTSFVGGISGTTLTITSIIQGNLGQWQPLRCAASGFVPGTFIISQPPPDTGGIGQYTVNISQTVAAGSTFTANSVPWNPTGVVPLGSAYINYPNTIKFAANPDGSITTASNNAKIVLYEADSNSVRLIDLAANTIKPLFQFAQNLRGGVFSWFDIDIHGACMKQNEMIFPNHNLSYNPCSFDGSYTGPNWNGNPAPFGAPDVFWGSGITEGPNRESDLVLDPSQAAYPWAVCFCMTRAAFLMGGFREFGLMLWRAPLRTDPDPQMPQANKDLYANGYLMWSMGTSLFFPRGVRSSLATLHGGMGFGHLGSDVGKTVHDICVSYNNGSAAYNAAGDHEALLNSVFIDPTGTAGPDRTSGTPGANALGMGRTKRPEWNVESYDWQAISFFLRRTTTAGTYPVPALPGPTPAPTALPKISSVVITRKSFTEIDVAWDTDKSTIGLACAASSSNYNNTFRVRYKFLVPLPYSAWSTIEDSFKTTGHSATIPWCPMSIPTHVSVVVKDRTGNFVYAQDQTIGIHSDGTFIQGGTGLVPNNTVKLVNNFGEWTFGEQFAPQPGGGGEAFFFVTLNGRRADAGPTSPVLAAQQLQIDQGGYLWAKTTGSLWRAWINGCWYADVSNKIVRVNSSYPNVQAVNPPYPVSPDGSAITGTSGSLSNEFGVWTIDGSGNVNLNGLPLRSGVGFASVAVSQLQVNAHGQMFLQLSSDSSWRVYTGNRLNASTGPGSGPIPIDITFTRSSVRIAHSPIGPSSVMATVKVTMSEGSAFSGVYAIGVDGAGHQTGAMSGNNLYLNYDYGGTGATLFPVTATQNGASFTVAFHEQLS